MSIVIWHDLLFDINKSSKVTQTSGFLLEVVETEIKATQKVLKKYRGDDYNSAATCAPEIAEAMQIDFGFVKSRPIKKKRMFEYEAAD